MQRILIACSMLEDEIKKVYKEIECNIPVIWVERGFHNTPEKLNGELQKIIDEHQDCDEILLTFGLCGNGTEGIVSKNTMLVMPRFDDCINMLLCKGKRESRGLTKADSIYITRGWTLDSESILSQYDKYVEDYGEESAEGIIEMMYQHYKTITVIDTDSYEKAPVMEYANQAARLLGLSSQMTEGSTKVLRDLLLGNWEEHFIVQKPGCSVTQTLFYFP
ncbi:MAG: DUF1638 domain-containing protein [Lachnospiraceae bacterium]|nr:DUF1638 domain-containing protein [Lachnospiraceae bacterium]